MAKKQKPLVGLEPALQRMRETLEGLGYTDLRSPFTLMEIEPGKREQAALVAFDGNEPVVLCHPVEEGEAEKPAVQDEAKFKAGIVMLDKVARYVWVSDGDFDIYFNMARESPVSDLPSQEIWRREAREAMSTSRRRHIQVMGQEYFRGGYQAMGRRFDELHEAIYGRRAGVGTTNDAIDEVCKLIFLKIHLERHPTYEVQTLDGKRFAKLFNADYIGQNGRAAVGEIREAFHEIKGLEEYADYDITGNLHTVFAPDEPFRLNNPDVLAFAVQTFQDLRLSIDDRVDRHLEHEDLLGRAFDIFLRGKYDSSGGLATYLTPREVVEAMARMAFHDIEREDYQRLWAGYPENPQFLMGDLTCGTGRFLIGTLAEVKRLILDEEHVGHSDEEKLAWLSKMKRHSFFGADAAPGSILKARINMLMYGDGHSQLLTVEDSILERSIDRLMGKFDLILTNPPFGSGKYATPEGLEKMRGRPEYYHAEVRHLLSQDAFRPAMGWKWKPGNPSRRREQSSADPAILFLDRNLQMLRPGGRLLMIVPDGLLSNSDDRYVREYLMGRKDPESGKFLGGKAVVRAVVSLPTHTFAISGTQAKTSFIYAQKKQHPSDEQGPIFMAVAENVGFIKKGTSEVPVPKNDLIEIVNAYCQGYERETWVDEERVSRNL